MGSFISSKCYFENVRCSVIFCVLLVNEAVGYSGGNRKFAVAVLSMFIHLSLLC